MKNKKIALIGCGDIACRLGESLIQHGAEVHGFRRSADKIPTNFMPHAVDVCDVASLDILRQAFDYVVITLSPGERTDAAYKSVYVDGLDNILSHLDLRHVKQVFWASSTSVYGQNDGSWIDESSVTAPQRFSGEHLLKAESLLAELGKKACAVRFSGIYRNGRHRYIEQLKQGILSAYSPEKDYFTNRIHIEDCVAVLLHLLLTVEAGDSIDRVYVASDCEPVKYNTLVQWLSGQLGLPLAGINDSPNIRVGSKRCSNKRLLASGYDFIYPSFKEGFDLFRAI